jgi:hypothetical protein
MKTEWCVCRPTHSSVCRRRSPPAPCTYTNCALTFAWPSDARPRLQGSEWLPFIRRRRRRWLVIGGRLPRGRCAMTWCKRCIWLLNGFLSHRESSRTHTSLQSLPALGARAGGALPAVGSGAVGHARPSVPAHPPPPPRDGLLLPMHQLMASDNSLFVVVCICPFGDDFTNRGRLRSDSSS